MLPQMRAKALLLSAAALAAAIPALAQDRPGAAPTTTNTTSPTAPTASPTQPPAGATGARPSAAPGSTTRVTGTVGEEQAEIELGQQELPPPPVELPDHARRDPTMVGPLRPADVGLGATPWRGASGAFLSTLMRRLDTPIASRWAHIALRNGLLARVRAPRNVHPVDWAAERAWLLLRMGEADAARMIVSAVDVDRFTPKMFQIAMQSALANADPAALCPLQDGLAEVEAQTMPLVDAMCDALSGEPESAAAQIESVRRRGRLSGIDVALAEKIVGATANTGRAATIEWEPVEQLNAWRFGLATATGMTFPERLIDSAPPRMRAWQAVAPIIAPEDRLESARIAAGLGVLSSQALIDLHSLIYDRTGPDEIPETDAWQLRLAFVGEDLETRLAAMRRLWDRPGGSLQREAARALLGRAAARVEPDPELQEDAPDLIASMLAAGYDREAAEWASAVAGMDDRYADESWAMLALGAPENAGVGVSLGRINAFIGRDQSPDRKRSALLVAGLAGLGRIDVNAAARLSARYGLRLDHRSRWTRMIDRAAALGQSGTVRLLTATGLQSESFAGVPPSHLFHAIAALKNSGQDFTARMIAAEALART
jgi:hypothetical protein